MSFGASPGAATPSVNCLPDGRIVDEAGTELHGDGLAEHCRRIIATQQGNGMVALFMRIGMLEHRLNRLELRGKGLP